MFEELDAGEGCVVGLGAGVEFDGREVAFEQTEVLDDGGIDTGVVELMQHGDGIVNLVVKKEGVDGGEDAAMVKVGVVGQLLDVLDGVAGCYAGTESGCADVDGVGTMIDGFATLFKVFGGREEFQLHGYSILKR